MISRNGFIGLAWAVGILGMSLAFADDGKHSSITEHAHVSGQLIEPQLPPLPDVTLTNQNGQPIRLQDLLDNTLSVINFIYTSCSNVCPLTTANFVQLNQMAADQDFQILSISIDPKRDSPARLRKFAEAQGAISPRWTFLTGSTRTIGPLLGGFGFFDVAIEDHSPGVVIWDGRRHRWSRIVSVPPPHVLYRELERFIEP